MIKLKAGKTECIMLGASQNLSTVCNQFQLFHNCTPIYVAKSYKCLGTNVSPSLNLAEEFDKTYKKMSVKLKLKYNLTNEATKSMMVSLIQTSIKLNTS